MKSQPIPNTNSGHKKNPQVSEIWSYFEHDMSWWKFGQREREQQAIIQSRLARFQPVLSYKNQADKRCRQ